MVDSEKKQQLLAKFSAYLDSTDADSNQPEQDNVDLYRLFSELAALKTEVKLESRQIKTVIEEFQVLTDLLKSSNEQLSAELTERHKREQEQQKEIERPFLLSLLDLRDRIATGSEQALYYRPGWLARLDGRAPSHIKSLQQGMEISLRRLDGLLSRYKVEPVDAKGKRLNPHTMQVSAVEHRLGFEDGVVLLETRKGYLRDGQLLRVAEVTVNKSE